MKVFLFCLPAPHMGPDDWCGFALSEKGELLATHISSSPSWSRRDMERKAYPEGSEVIWVEEPDFHEALKLARELNRKDTAAARLDLGEGRP